MSFGSEHVYTPSELNREIKLHLEAGFPRVVVEAEISNLSRPASGHLYFSLKDERAQLRCAMFRSAASRMTLQAASGMKVTARGRISLYEPRGDYQFIVDSMQDAGEGLLQRRFEELKKKLEAEGLFDPAGKKNLPQYPARIGLITSPSGAAVRDLLQVLKRRWPVASVRLYPVRVQGAEAPPEILAALQAANRHQWADLLIMGRGGGSLEDLMAFNDEALARGVFASEIPVVSAVGHETDFSICDFVADLRAPTPSAAAELATPDRVVLREQFDRACRQLMRRSVDRVHRDTQKLDHLNHRLQQRHPALQLAEQQRQLDAASHRLHSSLQRLLQQRSLEIRSLSRQLASHRPERKLSRLTERLVALRNRLRAQAGQALNQRRDKLSNLSRTLNAVSPLQTIGRGYAVLTAPETGQVISTIAAATKGDRVFARVSDGELDCTVDEIRPSKVK